MTDLIVYTPGHRLASPHQFRPDFAGFRKSGTCKCGWRAPKRWTTTGAVKAYVQHLNDEPRPARVPLAATSWPLGSQN